MRQIVVTRSIARPLASCGGIVARLLACLARCFRGCLVLLSHGHIFLPVPWCLRTDRNRRLVAIRKEHWWHKALSSSSMPTRVSASSRKSKATTCSFTSRRSNRLATRRSKKASGSSSTPHRAGRASKLRTCASSDTRARARAADRKVGGSFAPAVEFVDAH